jgi:hypothetical protein
MTSSSLGHRNAAMDFSASPIKQYAAPGVLHTFEGKEHAMLAFKSYNIDRIKILVDGSELPAPTSTSSTPFLDALAVSSHASNLYVTHQTNEEAFWRTIIADTHPLHRPAPHDYWRHWAFVSTRSDTLRTEFRSIAEDKELPALPHARIIEQTSSSQTSSQPTCRKTGATMVQVAWMLF